MTRTTVDDVPNQPKTPKRTVRIDGETWDAFKALCEAEGISMSEDIRAMIEDRLFRAGRSTDDPRPSTRG